MLPSFQFIQTFTSNGENVIVTIPSGINWIRVYNLTQAAANQTTPVGVMYEWNSGFANGSQWIWSKSNAADAANLITYVTTSGFTLYDSTNTNPGPLVSTITAISTATIPVVTNTGPNGLVAAQTVRLINVTGALQLGGMTFTVGQNTLSSTTFSLDYMSTLSGAGTTGSFRVIPVEALYQPARRYITAITQAASMVVTMSVIHNYLVGQEVRLLVPAAFGMVQANALNGTITAVSNTATTNSITLNINSTSFSAFVFPLTAAYPFTFAEVIPFGEDTAQAISSGTNILADTVFNTGAIGLTLTGGVNNPGGASADNMVIIAGTVDEMFTGTII